MKKLFTLIILFLIVACTEDTSVNSQSEATQESVIGWRSAGFSPVISSQRGGGLQKLTHSGNWLVLMDAWTSLIEGKPGTSTYFYLIFINRHIFLDSTIRFIRNSITYSFVKQWLEVQFVKTPPVRQLQESHHLLFRPRSSTEQDQFTAFSLYIILGDYWGGTWGLPYSVNV